jgi:TRAP-type C4-dicarboxylate transport system permease small subunit
LAGVLTIVLAASILLGIILRQLSVNNAWTYDLDHFSLVWLAFIGAAYTGYLGGHVTAGISIERLLSRGKVLLLLVRFVIVAGFLILFIWSGYLQFHSSWLSHETTVDIFQWPVWIAKLAIPVGCAAWFAGELHKFLAALAGPSAIPPTD